MKSKFYLSLAISLMIFGINFLPISLAAAANSEFGQIKFLQLSDGVSAGSFTLPTLNSNYSASLIDLGGDGQQEILLGAGSQSEPLVKILRSDGSLVNSFLAYDKKFVGGVKVAGCDFDNDGQGEILTSAGLGGSAHIRIFNSDGQPKINAGFFAFDQKQLTGAEIACVDISGDKKDEIVAVGLENNKPVIKIFDSAGQLVKQQELDFKSDNVSLSAIDLGGDGIEEILVAGGRGNEPVINIYRGDLSLVDKIFLAAENIINGLSVWGADIDQDNQGEILVGQGVGGSPLITVFGNGKIKNNLPVFSFDDNFLGGVKPMIGDINGDKKLELILLPQSLPTGRLDLYKYIDIDVSEQRFRYYQNGYLIDDVLTSTGKPSTPTRLGEFTAFSKYDMAYGGVDGQSWGMPYFIGFYKSGSLENGIHELPFLNGRREGATSLGRAVSHGCVRLGIGVAKEVYDWVEINKTKVIVHK